MLVESTGFLDALDASAVSSKKDLKKRKRTASGSGKKDEPESPKIEAKPLKFYKDTSEENAEDEKSNENNASPTKELDIDIKIDNKNDVKKSDESIEEELNITISDPVKSIEEPDEKRPPGIGTGPDGPSCILVKPNVRRRMKRSIRWRPDEELTDVRYFELDENERVNVNKSFTEQKRMEHSGEREFLLSRKMHNEDNMVEQTSWRTLIIIDDITVINYGSKSREAEIQNERERNTLQEIFYEGRAMSDSPHEPDHEDLDHFEPVSIPLEDVTGNPNAVSNFRDISWPAPKGEQQSYIPSAFNNIFGSITPNIPPAPIINSPTVNPLVALNLPGLQSTLGVRDPTSLNYIMQAAQTASPFLQPPPMIQNNYQSNGNFPNRNMNSGSVNGNNFNNRNRPAGGGGGGGGGSGSGGSNWVRGSANMRRGMCHQYQRNGFCRNRNSGCPYIHER